MSSPYTSEAGRVSYRDFNTYRVPLYSIDIQLRYLKQWLDDKEEFHDSLDLSPPFQRGYVWNVEQKIKYMEYFHTVGYSGMELHWNCRDWSTGLAKEKFQIVDGKQRLSAALDFLDNKIPIFGYYHHQITGRPPLHARFKMKVADLQTDLDVANWYLALNTGGTYHTEEDIKIARDYRDSLLKDKE